jgi:hypothetical protein
MVRHVGLGGPSSAPPRRGCSHEDRRVIRLNWPYAEARVVRARLVAETGRRFEVSPLFRTDGDWAFSICRDCATRRALALAVFFLVRRWLIGALAVPFVIAVALGAVVTAIESPLLLIVCALAVLTLGMFVIGCILPGPIHIRRLYRSTHRSDRVVMIG